MKKIEERFDFEPFAKTTEYRKVNSEIVRSWIETMLQRGMSSFDCLLDIATGSGAMVQLFLAQMPVYWKQCAVICLDQSEEALNLVQRRLIGKVERLHLIHSQVEEMTLPPGSIDVAVWGNGIHYLSEEVQKRSIKHIKQVLKPGGWLLFNTSFYDGARSSETLSFYRVQVKKAVEFLRASGIQRTRMESRPEASKFLPRSYYEQLVDEADFKHVEAKEFTVRLYRKAWEHISSFHQYAAGALHGYPSKDAAIAMQKAVAPALIDHGQKDEQGNLYIPRSWLAISASA
jgi:ubiquinone/menaquinone biosynthesis C-methylase UbiE